MTLRICQFTQKLTQVEYGQGSQLGSACELTPSPVALANGIADRLTDVVILTTRAVTVNLYLFADKSTSVDGERFSPDMSSFLGSIRLKPEHDHIGNWYVSEAHGLSIPVYSTSATRKCYVYVTRCISGTQRGINLGEVMVVRLGVE